MPIIKDRITNDYVQELQWIYHGIDKVGIRIHTGRLAQAEREVNEEITKHLAIIKNKWGCHVYVGAANDDGTDTSVNLNASSGKRTPLLKFKELGYDVPKVSQRDPDTGEYHSKDSLAELALQKMLATNQFNIIGGDPVIRALLSIRELQTLKTRYINANLYFCEGEAYFLTNYNVAGTGSGRRSARKHAFGYGGNAQNFPKHGVNARIFRRCLVTRPGKIFLFVDQIQAEDWPVSALAKNENALNDLRTGIDRHKKLAMAVFRLNEDFYDEKGWKDSTERYLGKKIRHANNYDMRGPTMSDSLAKEGYSLGAAACQGLLDVANMIDPNIKGVFHEYVRRTIYDTGMLTTPFGREHQFFGLRPGDNSGNNKVFREGYAFIPQSSIGDNTGFAVYDLSYDGGGVDNRTASANTPFSVIQESHDSIAQEIDDSVDTIWNYCQRTIKAFRRVMVFGNGFQVEVPVEGEIGYSFYKTVTLKNLATGSKKLEDIRYKDIQVFYNILQEIKEKEREEDAILQTTP